jgi:hypothetical protein
LAKKFILETRILTKKFNIVLEKFVEK